MKVRIERDIVFGEGRIGFHDAGGAPKTMPLRLDAYLPEPRAAEPVPALVMAFGGAFHRGSKENDAFSDGVGTSTAVADYCQHFASLGMAAFSVQYRLAQVDPEPGTPLLTEPDKVPMSRINPVRLEMGLPPAEPRTMAEIMEAAFDDVAAAVAFIKDRAGAFGVDPARVVLGGFSAGGRCAMYVAYGKQVGVAGVVSLSGPLVPVDAAAFLADGRPKPPLLLISGERDLDYVVSFVPALERQFQAAGVEVRSHVLPGATHFYAAETATREGPTVRDAITEAVERWVGPIASI